MTRGIGVLFIVLGIALLLLGRALAPAPIMPQRAIEYVHGAGMIGAFMPGFILLLIGAKRAVS